MSAQSKCCVLSLQNVRPLFTCTDIFAVLAGFVCHFVFGQKSRTSECYLCLLFGMLDSKFRFQLGSVETRVCTFLFSQGRVQVSESQTFSRGPLVFYLYYIQTVVSPRDQIHCFRQDETSFRESSYVTGVINVLDPRLFTSPIRQSRDTLSHPPPSHLLPVTPSVPSVTQPLNLR